MAELKYVLVSMIAITFLACDSGLGSVSHTSETKNFRLDETTFNAANLRLVEERTAIALPIGSRGIRMIYQGDTIDPALVAKIEIPLSRVDEFAIRIKALRSGGTSAQPLAKSVEWWTPATGSVVVERRSDPNGNYLHIVLCREVDRGVVYIEWQSV